MPCNTTRRLPAVFALLLALAVPCSAQKVDVKVHTLDNGMQLLLLPREGDPNISCGWLTKFGSVNERPGVTGVAHLFEHMMFKGTHVIGTSDIQKDLEIIAKLDLLRAQIREEDQALIEKHRRGLVADSQNPENRTQRHRDLLNEFEDLIRQQRELTVKDEFDRIYTLNGASGMNAGTDRDFTIYFINVPSNKLELWFWMEADRLLNPVFREFYSERDVVHEERRLRIDSTPTGRLDEQFEAMFWQSSPYSWPVVGWPSDIDSITRQEAQEFYSLYYAPNNLTGVLVGDFAPEDAIRLAEKYFGRLKRGPRPPEPVKTREIEQLAEKRLTGEAETQPTVRIRYHTVADGHTDEPPLLMLSSILNGRTGRLFKSLVEEQKVATAASASVNGMKYEGYFEVGGVARAGRAPEDVEGAVYKELLALQRELVNERELQKVKNQELASDFRRLQSKTSLMFQLLIYEALGSWENVNRFSERMQAVTRQDIRRVARRYFRESNRNVAIYYTKGKRTQSGTKLEDAETSSGGNQGGER